MNLIHRAMMAALLLGMAVAEMSQAVAETELTVLDSRPETPRVPPVSDATPPKLPDPELRALSSGATLAVLERPGLPLVHVELSVAWPGSTASEEDQLAAGLASTLLAAGTTERSGEALAAAMDRLGAHFDVGVSTSRLWVDLNVPVAGLEAGLDLVAEVVHASTFPRREGRQEANNWADWREDVHLDIRRAHARALNHSWYPPGHPSRYSASPAEIRRVRAADARDLVQRIVREGRAFFAVAGAVDADALLPGFERRFGGLVGTGWTTEAPPVDPSTRLWLVDRGGFDAAELTVMLPAPHRGAPDEPLAALLMELAAGGFTSRMVSDLREARGITYSVYGDYERWSDSGRFVVEVEVPAERVTEARNAIADNLERLAAGGVTDDELRRARNALMLRAGRALQTNRQAAAWLGELTLLGLDVASEQAQLEALERATTADIDALASTLCDPARQVWVITGDRDVIEPLLEAEGQVPDRILSAQALSEEP